jgi:hypothetical protein
MTTKYAILNPLDGCYEYETEHTAAVATVARIALEFYKVQAHGTLCSYVEVAEDGSEKWYAEDGSRVISPAELDAEVKARIAQQMRTYNDIPITITGDSA